MPATKCCPPTSADFCHERAVDKQAHFQERRSGLGAIRTRRIELKVPIDIRVLDIGNGMKEAGSHEPTIADVTSAPFTIFLDGLQRPEAWGSELPSIGLRDIISSMPRSMAILATPAEILGENRAIVGGDYMNLSLRLGYHFSVIDTHLGSDEHRNYVYFRFAGGLADPERRARRAKFIGDVLRAMDFKVEIIIKSLQNYFRKRRQRLEENAMEELKARDHAFRIFLENNGSALELIAEIDSRLFRAEQPDVRTATEELLAVTGELVDGLNLLSGDAHAGLYAFHGRMAGEVLAPENWQPPFANCSGKSNMTNGM